MSVGKKVALVHDCLRQYEDAERMLEVLHRLYPDAPVYTAFIDHQGLGAAAERFADWEIRTTAAQALPGISHYFHAYRGLFPYFWEAIDLTDFDLVISASGNYFSQAVLTAPRALHVSYCHTPPAYLWQGTHPTLGAWPQQWYELWLQQRLRQYDFYAAQRVDRFVTNSQTVARRIHKFYRRPAEVIPPPVRVEGSGGTGERYYLYVGSLTPSAQVDLAIAACTRLERPLWIIGTGSEAKRLEQLAGANVRFLTTVSDAELAQIYANTRALIFPCTQADFGFAPVEAMGRGVPVIAYKHCGMQEVVLDYRTGVLFSEPTVDSLCEAIAQVESFRFSSQACIQRAEEFSESVFISKFEWFIAQALDEHTWAGTPKIEK